MKVLLIENVQGLGKAGDICEVKDGYGQNFLIAKGKAKLATNEVINRYKAQQKQIAQNKALELAEQKQLAQSLESLEITIAKKVGANNALFGAVTKDEIAHAINEHIKAPIDKKWVILHESIKHTGDFSIEVKLGNGLSANLTLHIIGQ
ncbi:50S ribosomal protein L9 [Helicobacter equorum]|uniref:50S ribosomal protein L9 n=1 Tax=Helicobacter equorum TaxID=361872 RepID=UPI000CF03E54|nr:50S ribosomal protein L9 [Helicobacter equorum]